MTDDRGQRTEDGRQMKEGEKVRGWEGGKVRSDRDRVLNSECGMRKEIKGTEDRGRMKEGEKLGRWEGEMKSGQSFEFGVRNAARSGATASIKWHQSGTKVLNEQ